MNPSPTNSSPAMSGLAEVRRICLWSGPRNVSTALMYAFAQRADTEVIDEPLYGHYLKVSGADHPGRETVLEAMQCDGQQVIESTIFGPSRRPVRFFKCMAHHLRELSRDFLTHTENLLLIRDPVEVLPTLSVQIPNPQLEDTGYQQQVEILDCLESRGQQIEVLDAKHLLLNPAAVLETLCDRLRLPFSKAMLHWPAGKRDFDGVWAPWWYHNVHQSTGFIAYREKTAAFPDALRPLLEQSRPLYERLLARAIRADEHGAA